MKKQEFEVCEGLKMDYGLEVIEQISGIDEQGKDEHNQAGIFIKSK